MLFRSEYILKLLIINKFVDNPSNKPLFWDATQDYRNIMITFSKGQKHLFDYKTMQICKPLSSNSEDIINPNLNLYENLVKSDHSPIESHNRIQTDHINILKNYDKKTDEFKEKALSSSKDDSKKYNWEEYKEKYLEKIIQFNVDF